MFLLKGYSYTKNRPLKCLIEMEAKARPRKMNQNWQSLINEASLSAEHLALGSTMIGKADYTKSAYYDLAFFSLSIGMERTSKLILIIDYLIKNDFNFPKNDIVKEYRHNLKKLLNEVNEICRNYNLNNRLPDTEIHKNIVEILTSFANNITRYYNFDYLTGGHSKINQRDYPIKEWFKLVMLPIWNEHQKEEAKKQKEAWEEAEKLATKCSFWPVVQYMESGLNAYTLYDICEHNKIIEFVQPYQRMYVMQIVRFLSVTFRKLEDKFWHNQSSLNVPYLSEVFYIFDASDNYLKKTKTWSLYK